MKKTILSIAVIAVFLSLGLGQSFACSCMMPEDPVTSMNKSSKVFVWKVLSLWEETMSSDFREQKITQKKVVLRVEKNFKWAYENTQTLYTTDNSAMCWVNFIHGERYIIYSYKDLDEKEQVSLCSRTSLLENAKDDIKSLDAEAKKETRICTMQYAPVCGIDKNTYWNACSAGNVEISYTGECSSKNKIKKLEEKLGTKITSKIDTALEKYTEKLNKKTYSEVQKNHKSILEKATEIQEKIWEKYADSQNHTTIQKLIDIVELIKMKIAAML